MIDVNNPELPLAAEEPDESLAALAAAAGGR